MNKSCGLLAYTVETTHFKLEEGRFTF